MKQFNSYKVETSPCYIEMVLNLHQSITIVMSIQMCLIFYIVRHLLNEVHKYFIWCY